MLWGGEGACVYEAFVRLCVGENSGLVAAGEERERRRQKAELVMPVSFRPSFLSISSSDCYC